MIARAVIASLVLFMATPSYADMIVETASEFRAAAAGARAGETIIVRAGNHDIGEVRIDRDLTIRGEDGAVLYASSPVAKGVLNPLWGVSLTIENLTIRSARSPDLNGAAIRHDGLHLDIRGCVLEGNENGVLATGQENGVIRIADTQFLRNGHGDGYSHGIYVVRAERLEITESAFIGTRIGHHVKSLAGETRLIGNRFDDADGRTSYAVDASRGGSVTIRDNTIVQARDSENATIINYDTSRGGEARSLTISGNTITNYRRGARLLRNATGTTPVMNNNKIQNEAGGPFREQ
ncbi:MAG: right-handed parallel beta-helix repeat-containing protein [Pseudomonadota bacterium]